jgi:hypothetical protein
VLEVALSIPLVAFDNELLELLVGRRVAIRNYWGFRLHIGSLIVLGTNTSNTTKSASSAWDSHILSLIITVSPNSLRLIILLLDRFD